MPGAVPSTVGTLAGTTVLSILCMFDDDAYTVVHRIVTWKQISSCTEWKKLQKPAQSIFVWRLPLKLIHSVKVNKFHRVTLVY